MSKLENRNIDIEQLKSDLNRYRSTLQEIRKKYLSEEKPPSEISMQTDIIKLPYVKDKRKRQQIYTALCRAGIKCVNDLLDAFKEDRLSGVRGLGPDYQNTLTTFIESKLLSKSITDLYYEMFQHATCIKKDLQTTSDIFYSIKTNKDTVNKYWQLGSSDKPQRVHLLNDIDILLTDCLSTQDCIIKSYDLIESYKNILERVSNGEFIELQASGNTLINASEQNRIAVLKEQLETCRTTIVRIRDKYSSSINAISSKSNVQSDLLKDKKTIDDLLHKLQNLQKKVENPLELEQWQCEKEHFQQYPYSYLSDPNLREKLNKIALCTILKDLISACSDILEKIGELMQQRFNGTFINPIDTPHPLGGISH